MDIFIKLLDVYEDAVINYRFCKNNHGEDDRITILAKTTLYIIRSSIISEYYKLLNRHEDQP